MGASWSSKRCLYRVEVVKAKGCELSKLEDDVFSRRRFITTVGEEVVSARDVKQYLELVGITEDEEADADTVVANALARSTSPEALEAVRRFASVVAPDAIVDVQRAVVEALRAQGGDVGAAVSLLATLKLERAPELGRAETRLLIEEAYELTGDEGRYHLQLARFAEEAEVHCQKAMGLLTGDALAEATLLSATLCLAHDVEESRRLASSVVEMEVDADIVLRARLLVLDTAALVELSKTLPEDSRMAGEVLEARVMRMAETSADEDLDSIEQLWRRAIALRVAHFGEGHFANVGSYAALAEWIAVHRSRPRAVICMAKAASLAASSCGLATVFRLRRREEQLRVESGFHLKPTPFLRVEKLNVDPLSWLAAQEGPWDCSSVHVDGADALFEMASANEARALKMLLDGSIHVNGRTATYDGESEGRLVVCSYLPPGEWRTLTGGVEEAEEEVLGVAVAHFDSSLLPDSLNFAAHDRLLILERVDESWLRCRHTMTGEVGLAPRAFLRMPSTPDPLLVFALEASPPPETGVLPMLQFGKWERLWVMDQLDEDRIIAENRHGERGIVAVTTVREPLGEAMAVEEQGEAPEMLIFMRGECVTIIDQQDEFLVGVIADGAPGLLEASKVCMLDEDYEEEEPVMMSTLEVKLAVAARERDGAALELAIAEAEGTLEEDDPTLATARATLVEIKEQDPASLKKAVRAVKLALAEGVNERDAAKLEAALARAQSLGIGESNAVVAAATTKLLEIVREEEQEEEKVEIREEEEELSSPASLKTQEAQASSRVEIIREEEEERSSPASLKKTLTEAVSERDVVKLEAAMARSLGIDAKNPLIAAARTTLAEIREEEELMTRSHSQLEKAGRDVMVALTEGVSKRDCDTLEAALARAVSLDLDEDHPVFVTAREVLEEEQASPKIQEEEMSPASLKKAIRKVKLALSKGVSDRDEVALVAALSRAQSLGIDDNNPVLAAARTILVEIREEEPEVKLALIEAVSERDAAKLEAALASPGLYDIPAVLAAARVTLVEIREEEELLMLRQTSLKKAVAIVLVALEEGVSKRDCDTLEAAIARAQSLGIDDDAVARATLAEIRQEEQEMHCEEDEERPSPASLKRAAKLALAEGVKERDVAKLAAALSRARSLDIAESNPVLAGAEAVYQELIKEQEQPAAEATPEEAEEDEEDDEEEDEEEERERGQEQEQESPLQRTPLPAATAPAPAPAPPAADGDARLPEEEEETTTPLPPLFAADEEGVEEQEQEQQQQQEQLNRGSFDDDDDDDDDDDEDSREEAVPGSPLVESGVDAPLRRSAKEALNRAILRVSAEELEAALGQAACLAADDATLTLARDMFLALRPRQQEEAPAAAAAAAAAPAAVPAASDEPAIVVNEAEEVAKPGSPAKRAALARANNTPKKVFSKSKDEEYVIVSSSRKEAWSGRNWNLPAGSAHNTRENTRGSRLTSDLGLSCLLPQKLSELTSASLLEVAALNRECLSLLTQNDQPRVWRCVELARIMEFGERAVLKHEVASLDKHFEGEVEAIASSLLTSLDFVKKSLLKGGGIYYIKMQQHNDEVIDSALRYLNKVVRRILAEESTLEKLMIQRGRSIRLEGPRVEEVTGSLECFASIPELEKLYLARPLLLLGDLSPLAGLGKLRHIEISDAKSLTGSLDCLSGLPCLEHLRIRGSVHVTGQLASSKLLKTLDLEGTSVTCRLGCLKFPKLVEMNLRDVGCVSGTLQGLPRGLTLLKLRCRTKPMKLKGDLKGLLKNCPLLRTLSLENGHSLTGDIEPIKGLKGLQHLNLHGSKGLEGSIEGLPANLESLDLSGSAIHAMPKLRGDLSSLGCTIKLKTLDLSHCSSLQGGLKSLERLTRLESLRGRGTQLDLALDNLPFKRKGDKIFHDAVAHRIIIIPGSRDGASKYLSPTKKKKKHAF